MRIFLLRAPVQAGINRVKLPRMEATKAMANTDKEILVLGATGAQGGAALRHLQRLEFPLRALVRDPSKPAAKALADAGVRIFQGDMEDRATLDEAMRGAYGVFSVQNFWDGFPAKTLGFEGEVRQGKNVAEAAKEAGVKHLVQASVVGDGQRLSRVPHARSKHVIERHIRSLGVPFTFVRAPMFMDNWNAAWLGWGKAILKGRLDLPLRPDVKLQLVAVEDVGAFAAMALDRPRDFIGLTFDVVGDELTMPEMAEVWTRVTGREVRFVGDVAAIEGIRRQSEEFAVMWEDVNQPAIGAFLPGLRALRPELLTFEAFLRKTGWDPRGKA